MRGKAVCVCVWSVCLTCTHDLMQQQHCSVNNSTLLWPCRSLQCWPKSWTSAGNSCWRERRRSRSWRQRGTTHESVHFHVCFTLCSPLILACNLAFSERLHTRKRNPLRHIRGALWWAFTACEPHVFPAAARTSGVPGVPPWAQPEDDRGEEAGPVSGRGL